MFNPRTDLAMESFSASGKTDLPGVEVRQWEQSEVTLTEVVITDANTASQLGKPCGTYLTLESALLRDRDPDVRIAAANLLGEELARLIPPDDGAPVLIVGLGNRFVTPDSLGPNTIDRTLVTRHAVENGFSRAKMRSVAAIAPGVLGITGVETVEMVESLVKKLSPRLVICIDALAARASSRIGAAIQLTDAGIQPGGGVGNHRKPLNRETLGVDVVAVGMPTVIYAATLARDAFALLSEENSNDSELDAIERELLGDPAGEMIVTPREIDSIIQDASGILASGINRALHPNLSDAEIAAMMD